MQKSKLLTAAGVAHGFYDATDSSQLACPIKLTQIHSVKVVTVTALHQPLCPADALVTTHTDLPLTIKTADCAPVLLADTQHHVIGAAHAGWKGAVKGVTEQTVLAMIRLGADIRHIVAAIGPCIHQESYLVQPDMKALFSADEAVFFKAYPDGEHFDLPAYVAGRLRAAGVEQVDVLPFDTYTDTVYNSYRREATNPARQYSAIWLD